MSKRYIAITPYGEIELPKEILSRFRLGNFQAQFTQSHKNLITRLCSLDDNFPIKVYNGENLIDGGLYSVTVKTDDGLIKTISFHRNRPLPGN